MVDERRKHARIEIQSASLLVRDIVEGNDLGIVGNLSAGGMMLIANRELFQDGILQLSIEGESPKSSIPIGVRVLWSAPAHSPDEHWAGLEIIDISEAASTELAQLLTNLQQAG